MSRLAQPDLSAWSVNDSAELYQSRAWGSGYFSINDRGNVVVTAPDRPGKQIDLLALVTELERRGYSAPLLLRFNDILRHRVKSVFEAFANTIREYGYKGRYRGVYPIKVNQQRHVVEELIQFGAEYGLGVEAGSKPELLVALAMLNNPESLIICNGYKDREYVETALLSQKLGRNTIVVVDRFEELEHIIAANRALNIAPNIGLRVRLSAKGAGKWVDSTGDRSKFGLSATELVAAVEKLSAANLLPCCKLLHFHIGSQITNIRAIKGALQESTRIYVELCKLGANLQYVDVGGGLGVDYDGSQTNFHSSMNYSVQEYANDVVSAIQSACDEFELPHPDIVSESGRALVAHHAVLVFNVLGAAQIPSDGGAEPTSENDPEVVQQLADIYKGITGKNFVEYYHDAIELKDQATTLFNLGYLDLVGRSRAERLFWACCHKIHKLVSGLDYVPEEVAGLERALADVYYCNFSVFQSAPDHWAVKQLFPTMPIHRLTERPTRKATLVDLTCDSDGKVDQFIDLRDVKNVLELHPLNPAQPYYIGMFLVGAYQEILGDLHNLFGDTTAIHVSLDDSQHGYNIDAVVEGDSVTEVLGYVQYERQDLLRRVREATEGALRTGRIAMEESALLRKRFEEGLAGYTYLEGEE